ncbi:hypothetical protein ACWKSP_22025 [Micromonosporaceae bacterium Da 78-11]
MTPFRLLGTGPRAAARQSAALLALAGVLALIGIAGDPSRYLNLLLVAGCDFAVAAGALLFPWHRTGPNAPAPLGLSTWTFGGVASGTGPFLVLIYAWAGLHFPRWVLLAYTPAATLA